jgi:hypothetical protein
MACRALPVAKGFGGMAMISPTSQAVVYSDLSSKDVVVAKKG